MRAHLIKRLFFRMLFIGILCIGGSVYAAEESAEEPGEEMQSEPMDGETGSTSEAASSGENAQTSEGDQAATEGQEPPVTGEEEEKLDALYLPKQDQPKEDTASEKTVTVANTGAASYSYPLSFPPARGEAAPQLSINYNSQSRSKGVLGFAFGLGIPSIQRSTKRGLDYDASFDDAFVANGQELVSRQQTWGSGYYGAKTEGSFTRYRKYTSPGPYLFTRWVATTREGVVYFYGTSENSRQQFTSQRVFKWYLDRIEDTNGNYVTYEYEKDEGTVYLKAITYSHHENKAPMYEVVLNYDEQGGDLSTVSYETHYPTMKRWRLDSIDVTMGAPAQLIRKYQFHYRGWCIDSICDALGINDQEFGMSFLEAIEQLEYYYDGGAQVALYSTTSFQWHESDISYFTDIDEHDYPRPFNDAANPSLPKDPDINQQLVVFDFDGDNRDDILYYQFNAMIYTHEGNLNHVLEKEGAKYVKVFRSTADGYERVEKGVNTLFGRNFPKMTQITSFDYDGDNRDDLLFWNPHSNPEDPIDENRVWLYRSVKDSTNPEDAKFELVKSYTGTSSLDLFGDFTSHTAGLTHDRPDPIYIDPNKDYPPVVFKRIPGSSISPTDFNGDGKSDLLIFHKVRIYEGPGTEPGPSRTMYKMEIKALKSTGGLNGFVELEVPLDQENGLFPPPVDIATGAQAYEHDSPEVLPLDVNADGYSDIVTLIRDQLRVSLAQVNDAGHVTFAPATKIAVNVGSLPTFPPHDEDRFLRPVQGRRLHPLDFNGDGYTDLLVGAAFYLYNSMNLEPKRSYVMFRYDAETENYVVHNSVQELRDYFKITTFNFNDDGKTDLLVSCGIVRVSNGDGTFTTVKTDLDATWGWHCDDTGGPFNGSFDENTFNYSKTSFTPLDKDGNGVQEIYFEGNLQNFTKQWSPDLPADLSEDEFTQHYYRSMILGNTVGKQPYLVHQVTTRYGEHTANNLEYYHHKAELTYRLSSGSHEHDNHYMPQTMSLVTEVTESYGTNSTVPNSTREFEYSGARHFPADREFAGYEYVYTTYLDQFDGDATGDAYEVSKYYVDAEHEFKRGRLLQQILYEYKSLDVTPTYPDRVITEYNWVGTDMHASGEGWFVRLMADIFTGTPAKKVTTLDHGYMTSVETDYWYDQRNGFATKERSRLTDHTLPDGLQPEAVAVETQYNNFDEPNGWVWRKTEEYITGEYGGVSMYGRDHVHRATHWDYEENTGNLAYQWLVSSEGPPGSHQIVTQWQYDEFGNVEFEWDPNGNLTTYLYEDGLAMFYAEIQRPTTTNVATGVPTNHTISFTEYNYKHGKPEKIIDENTRVTEYSYDYLGRIKSIKRPHFTGDAKEETIYVDDAFPRYSDTFAPTQEGEVPLEVRTYIDGADRVMQTVTHGETVGASVQYIAVDSHYDTLGRKVKDEGPYFCNTKNFYPTTTCKSDVWLRQDFDHLDRVTAVETSGDIESTTEHYGSATKHTDPDGKVKWVYRDHRGNIVKIAEEYKEDNQYRTQKTYYSYNAANELLAISRADHLNQIGLQNRFVYDLYGRVVQTMDPDMGTWTYEYDDNGNLTQQTDANGVILEFTYDELNRKTTETAYVPKRGSAAYAPAWGFDQYYEEGDTVSYNDKVYVAAQGHWSSSSNRPPLDSCIWKVLTDWKVGEYYCAGERVGHNGLVYQSMMGHYASEDWEPGVDDAMWQLETEFEARNVSTFTYDEPSIDGIEDHPDLNLKGRPYSAQTADETKITFDEYDKGGRLVKSTKYIAGAPKIDGYSVESEYDFAGKPTLVKYPDDYELQYEYHPGTSLVKSVSNPNDPNNIKLAVLEDYQEDGKIGTASYGVDELGDFTTQTIYDYYPLTRRLKSIYSIKLGGGNGQGELQNKEYEYSPAGDVTKVEDFRAGVRYNYEYDDFHRLTAEKHYGIKFVGDEFETLTNTFEKAHPHAAKSTGRGVPGAPTTHYEYDNNGNLIRSYNARVVSGGTIRSDWKRISYNAKNMPVLIDNYETGQESTTEFGYDADYKRVRKTVVNTNGASSTIYVSKGYEVKLKNVGEPDEETETVKYIFAGNQRVAKVTDLEVLYIHKDHLGSTSVVTDSMGEYPDGEPEYTEYQPFGLPRPGSELSSKTDYAFTDQEMDRSTGFYNYDARLYNPEIGIFNTADSVLQDPYDPQLLNRYAYARNNPKVYVDPNGHEVVWFHTARWDSMGSDMIDESMQRIEEKTDYSTDVNMLATQREIENTLKSAGTGDMVLFSGHGNDTAIAADFMAFFNDSISSDELVSAATGDFSPPSVVYLGGCSTGEGSMLTDLVGGGVDIAIGFTNNVHWSDADKIGTVIAEQLANGATVKEAIAAAKQELKFSSEATLVVELGEDINQNDTIYDIIERNAE